MENGKVNMRLGADPEIFLQDNTGNLVSAIGYIKADKWNPLQIPGMAPGFTLQEDNVSLEYGIPPAATVEEFIHHINAVMEKSKEWVPGLSFSKLSCAVFPAEQLEHPLARVFGCEPDYNAWSLKPNHPPRPPNEFLRSAGGHIHVETQEDPIQVVRAMDLFLGVPSILMDNGKERRQLYGGPGAHRRKPYGVEYRTLSNFWIFEDRLIRWVWDNTARALSNLDIDFESVGSEIQHAISKGDVKLAESLCQAFNLEVV
jgi:hypothetical protein